MAFNSLWPRVVLLSLFAFGPALAAAPGSYESRLIALAEQADDMPQPVAEQPLLLKLTSDPRFEHLAPEQRAYVLAVAGNNALKLGQPSQAVPLLARACEASPDNAQYWYIRSIVEQNASQWQAATHSMAQHARLAPDRIADIEEDAIGPLLVNVAKDSSERRELLQVLFDAHWTYAAFEPSDQWYALAALKYEAGERDSIAPVLERIRTPFGMVRLRADRRFDTWVDRSDKRWDVRRAAQNELDDLRVRSLLDPDDMKIMASLAEQLTLLKQDEEAVRMTDEVAAVVGNYRINNGDGDGPYQHMDDYVRLLEERAQALENLGRDDEALALRRTLVEIPEADGRPNVDQRLNLAETLVGMRQPQEALALADQLQEGQLSPYGKTVQRRIRLYAAEQRQDMARVAQELEYIRAHRQESPALYLDTLLYLDLGDEAAAFVRDELASPSRRGDMLYYVQDWPIEKSLPANANIAPRRHALLDREDVRQALDAVGRRETYEISY